MTPDQMITLAVVAAVIAALILDRGRADVIALSGAAALLMSGVVRPVDVQAAFASPAILALAALFVIAYAMELSGLLDAAIRGGVALCRWIGAVGLWLMIALCGTASAFLNNTPIVVLAAPVVRDVSESLALPPKRFLMPLSYITVLGGCCTLIGTSTNLLVNDMAKVGGQPAFGMFEITPVGLTVAVVGGLYLLLFSGRALRRHDADPGPSADAAALAAKVDPASGQPGHAELFAARRKFKPLQALASITVFAGVVTIAAMDIAPIASAAFAGAVLLIILRVISADEAYQGLRPDVLLLIAGMVVLGIALEKSGLANAATEGLVGSVQFLPPLLALVVLYAATLVLTELLSNATVAVLVTPVAIALGETLGVDPRPFIVAVMIAASAAFATPFGYQTNAIVYQLGGYGYMDFVRVGLPLNLITWATAMVAIPYFFPF